MNCCRYLLRLRRYKRKSVEVGVFRRGGSLRVVISEGKGRRPPTTVCVRVAEWLPFRVVSKYLHCIISFCHNPRMCRTELRLPNRPRIRSRGKNKLFSKEVQYQCIFPQIYSIAIHRVTFIKNISKNNVNWILEFLEKLNFICVGDSTNFSGKVE